jgi:hypothetical protein
MPTGARKQVSKTTGSGRHSSTLESQPAVARTQCEMEDFSREPPKDEFSYKITQILNLAQIF